MCWMDCKIGWGVQEVLLDNASVFGSQRVGCGRCELKRERDRLVGRSIFCIENFTRNVDWDLGSTREGDQASGRNGKATTLDAVEMGVNWCAKMVMKEEREVNCSASYCRGGRRERGERSKQARLDGKTCGVDKETRLLLQSLDIITFQIEDVHHVKAKVPDLQ